MGWAAERARAVLGAKDGAFAGDGIAVAVAALDPDGPVIVSTEGLPPDPGFEFSSVTETMTATQPAVPPRPGRCWRARVLPASARAG
jgi:hypothetical protein